MTMRAACGLVDMDTSTVVRWMAADAAFRTDVARAHAEAEARFTAVITDDALGRPAVRDDRGHIIRDEVKPSVSTAMWWLEHRRREEYARHVQVDVMALVRRVAAETGLDEAEVLAEAERIVAGG